MQQGGLILLNGRRARKDPASLPAGRQHVIIQNDAAERTTSPVLSYLDKDDGTNVMTLVLEIWSWICSISVSRFIKERNHG